ncbi:MAG: hypothetical protein OEM59_06625 [Rhodospirillales bacterium]|nr:hypothetical protein [Rhodospirillales bacterium]
MTRSAKTLRMAERREAWTAAKLAVRRYAREPSESNAGKVRSAWLRVRHAMSHPLAGAAGAMDRRIEHGISRLPSQHPRP